MATKKIVPVVQMHTREYFLCDDCEVRMEWDGMTLTTNPPQYAHGCPACGCVETLRQISGELVTREFEAEDG